MRRYCRYFFVLAGAGCVAAPGARDGLELEAVVEPTFEYHCSMQAGSQYPQITEQQKGTIRQVFDANGAMTSDTKTVTWKKIIPQPERPNVIGSFHASDGTAEITLKQSTEALPQDGNELILSARIFSPHFRPDGAEAVEHKNEVGEVIIMKHSPEKLVSQGDDGWGYFGFHGKLLYANRSDSPQTILFFAAPVEDVLDYAGDQDALSVVAAKHRNPTVTRRGTSFPVFNKRMLGWFDLTVAEIHDGLAMMSALETRLNDRLAGGQLPSDICRKIEVSYDEIVGAGRI